MIPNSSLEWRFGVRVGLRGLVVSRGSSNRRIRLRCEGDMSLDLERTGRLSFSIEKRAFGWVFDLGIVISFGPRTTCQYLELIYR